VNVRFQRIVSDLPLAVNDTTWEEWPLPFRRARLPVRFGGLGLTPATGIMDSAYVSSLGLCWSSLGVHSSGLLDRARQSLLSLAHSTTVVESTDIRFPAQLALEHANYRLKALGKIFGATTGSSVDLSTYVSSHVPDIMAQLNANRLQHSLSLVVTSKLYDLTMREVISHYEPHLSSYYLARFLSSSCRESATWCTVVPTEPLFTISAQKYSYLLAFQIGSKIPNSHLWQTHCDCGTSLSIDPCHVYSCERRYPHDRVKVQLSKLCQAAGLIPTIEPLHTCHGPCQPDLAVPDLDSSGKTLLVDFTTADAAVASHLNRGSAKTYHVAWKFVEKAKLQKYGCNFDASLYSFLPVAMEASGRWSSGLARFFGWVKRFAKVNRIQNAVRHSLWVARWRKILSVVFRVSQIICLESLVQSLSADSSRAVQVESDGEY